MEIWKEIAGYGSYYFISNKGRVKSFKRKKETILTAVLDGKGYQRIRLYYTSSKARTEKIHRLVAKAFIPNPLDLPEVNHIDGDKANNNVENLEWISTKDNCIHRGTLGNWKPFKGVEHGMCKLTNEDVLTIYDLSHNSKLTQKQIGDKFNVSNVTVSDIKRGNNWSHITKHIS